jgi:hypothetical protein
MLKILYGTSSLHTDKSISQRERERAKNPANSEGADNYTRLVQVSSGFGSLTLRPLRIVESATLLSGFFSKFFAFD